MKTCNEFWIDIEIQGELEFESVPVCQKPDSSDFWLMDGPYGIFERYYATIDYSREDYENTPEMFEAQAKFARFESALCETAKYLHRMPFGSFVKMRINGDSFKFTKAMRDQDGSAIE